MYLSLKEAAAYLGYAESGLRDVVTRSRLQMAAGLPPDLQFAQGRHKGKLLFRREWLDNFVEVAASPQDLRPTKRKSAAAPTPAATQPLGCDHGLDWALLAI
jgi:hypothetical protein